MQTLERNFAQRDFAPRPCRRERIVLGVDPGCLYAGYSVMMHDGRSCKLLDCGVLTLNPKSPLPHRVTEFYEFFLAKILEYQVTELSLETPFLGKNAQNFLKLGYLRGALYIAATKNNITIHELAPTQVKQAVTGFGKADKEQIARLMHQLFPGLARHPKHDMTDAMAVALAPLLTPFSYQKFS